MKKANHRIKAIFFDIDGTLLTKTGRVAESTKQAIQAAQAKNILVGVATGRDPLTVKQLLGDLVLDVYVTYNGQLVYTNEAMIYAHPFSQRTLQAIVTYADEHNRTMNFGAADEVAGSRMMQIGQNPVIVRWTRFLPKHFPVGFMKKTLQQVNFFKSPDHYKDFSILRKPIYQCMMLSPTIEEAKLRQALPDCDFQRSNRFSVDIVPKGGSKYQGICHFLQHQGIEMRDAMAFGDHENDVEMLKGVGIGVAMGNGKPDTRAAADYITATNNQDGIAKALRHYGIIE